MVNVKLEEQKLSYREGKSNRSFIGKSFSRDRNKNLFTSVTHVRSILWLYSVLFHKLLLGVFLIQDFRVYERSKGLLGERIIEMFYAINSTLFVIIFARTNFLAFAQKNPSARDN